MAKAAVIAATAFILFIIFFYQTTPKVNEHLNLGRRSGIKHANFDPLVTQLEIIAESKGILSSDAVEEHSIDDLGNLTEIIGSSSSLSSSSSENILQDAYAYVDDNGKLNITLRLMVLFPMIDNSPKDGVIEFNELEAWNIKQAAERLDYRTTREIVAHDKDGDGYISFKEYLPWFSNTDIEKNNMEHGEAGWWKEQFRNADADKDGLLSFEEFKDFLHPEESLNEKIRHWLLREKTRRMDLDKDGRLSFIEFRDAAYDIFRNYYEFRLNFASVPSPDEVFADLDLNKDRYLAIRELKPIQHFLFPGEMDYASYYSTYLMHEVDENKDGRLTPKEILKHEHIFYNIVYPQNDHDDDIDDYHDEL